MKATCDTCGAECPFATTGTACKRPGCSGSFIKPNPRKPSAPRLDAPPAPPAPSVSDEPDVIDPTAAEEQG